MNRTACLLALCVAGSLAAQQTGNANRDYTINGAGSLQSSIVSSSIPTPALPMANVYSTLDANQPVIWAYATQGAINWIPGLAANSVDIGPAGLAFLLDGTNPTNPINLFARTNASGTFALTLPTSVPLIGASLFFAMAHASPSSPDGFYVSQTHQVAFTLAVTPTCNPSAANLGLGDDTFAYRTLAHGFSFYGTNYTDIYVGSNGTLCFGNSNPGFEFDPMSFAGAFEPQAAIFTTDLNPGAAGTVSFFSGTAFTEVCWNQVTEFGSMNSNTMKATLNPAGIITFDYGLLDMDGSTHDVLVGLTPGSNIGTVMLLDLSTGPHPIPNGATTAPCEYFSAFPFGPYPVNMVDLDFRSVTFLLDPMGNPFLQQ